MYTSRFLDQYELNCTVPNRESTPQHTMHQIHPLYGLYSTALILPQNPGSTATGLASKKTIIGLPSSVEDSSDTTQRGG